MSFWSSKAKVKKLSDLEEGDHIYVVRPGEIYSHHGIYVGNSMVVHFGVDKTNRKSSKGSRVTMTCLNCFMKGRSLRLYRYGVDSFTRMTVIGCTRRQSDPPQVVKERAMYLLRNGFGNYNLFKNNCEVFAIYCKTGQRIKDRSCGQASPYAIASTALRTLVGSIKVLISALVRPNPGLCSCPVPAQAQPEPEPEPLSHLDWIDSDTDSSDSISLL